MSTIFVVDGDECVRRLVAEVIREYFPEAHHELLLSGNGTKALADIKVYPFDLLVTGMNVPFVDGTTLAAAAKDLPSAPSVILMSGSPEPKSHRADAFIAKPFDADKLAEVIDRLLHRVSQ